MKKINKASELLWALGIIFVALGVAVCSKADLGVSMIAASAFVVYDAIAHLSPALSVGMTEYIIQGIMLILLCVIVRGFNWRYLLAFAVAVIYGYTLNLFIWLLSPITVTTVGARWALLILGDVITAFGVACFFGTYMPLQVYELFVTELARHLGCTINKVKWKFDMALLILSIALALLLFDIGSFDWSTAGYASFHSIGLGTFVTAAINSPLIALMSKLVNRFFEPAARFPAAEKLLKRG